MPDELLDIVNNNDIVTGQEMRSIVHQRGLQHRGVHAFLFTRDGKLLVQKRSKDRVTHPSARDCSISEHVKAGESYLDACVRGIREELGTAEVEIQPLVTFRMKYGPNDNEISTLFAGLVDPATVHFDPVEVERVDYFVMSELAGMMASDREKFCGWFIQITNWFLNKPSELIVLKTFTQTAAG